MAKYLDQTGLSRLWLKIKAYVDAKAGIPDGAVTTGKLADLSVTTPKIAGGAVTMAKLAQDVKDAMGGSSASPLDAYPVGAIYLSMADTSPQSLFGGTWQKLEGKFLMFSDSSHEAGSTGGSNDAVTVSHTHYARMDDAGSHTHSISGGSHSHSGSTGSAGSHSHSMGGDVLRVSSSRTNCGTTGSNIYWYATQHYNTDSAGSHSHSVSVNTGSSHSHTETSAGGHTHGISLDAAGGSGVGKNMPAYIAVNAWKRTA